MQRALAGFMVAALLALAGCGDDGESSAGKGGVTKVKVGVLPISNVAPLRFVPPGKQVVLGLVTTKRGELEDADVLKRRIDEAAKYVPLDQLCLSPQCGFSSTVEGNALSREQQAAKLALIVETAKEVWG